MESLLEICDTKIPVIKTIRFCDFKKFEAFQEIKDVQFKFIFLVRDPRGILNR